MLRYMRHEWDMEFVLSGGEALRAAGGLPLRRGRERHAHAGHGRLRSCWSRCRRRSPATVRIVLSGHCDRQAVMRTVEVAHQFLTKPCDSEDIKATVMRACRLADRLGDPWHRELVSRVTSVPSSLSAYPELAAELEAAEPSVDRVGEIVARDVGTAAKLLQLVSSSFFGSPRATSDPGPLGGVAGDRHRQAAGLREGAIHALERPAPRPAPFPRDLGRAQPSGGQVRQGAGGIRGGRRRRRSTTPTWRDCCTTSGCSFWRNIFPSA